MMENIVSSALANNLIE